MEWKHFNFQTVSGMPVADGASTLLFVVVDGELSGFRNSAAGLHLSVSPSS